MSATLQLYILENFLAKVLSQAFIKFEYRCISQTTAQSFADITFWYHRSIKVDRQTCHESVVHHPIGSWHLVDLQPLTRCKLTIRGAPQYFIHISFTIFQLESMNDDKSTNPCENSNYLSILDRRSMERGNISVSSSLVLQTYCGIIPPFSTIVHSSYIDVIVTIQYHSGYLPNNVYFIHEITWPKIEISFGVHTLYTSPKS